MDEGLVDDQTAIATAPAPAEPFAELPGRRQREVFFALPETVQASLVADMDREQLRGFVRRLDPEEVADVLGFAEEPVREEVLRRLDEDRREKAAFLLEFSPESAAGLMHLDYVTVDVDGSLAAVSERVERHEARTGRFPTIFVTEDDALLGELPGGTLAMADGGDVDLREHVQETPAVAYDSPDSDVVEVFRANPERTVAVLDDDGTILGVIYAADLLRVVEEEAGETLYEFTGGEWRWRLRARNGNVMADGGEGYASRTNAQDAVDKFKLNAPNADVEDAE